MNINCVDYPLSSDNYIPEESIKNQIIIGHSFNKDMRHYYGWKHRYNGLYKKTAAFTISLNGNVFQHFNPKFKSGFFENDELNNKSIVILLENEGWLVKKPHENKFITSIGDIYNKPEDIFFKKWRGFSYWCPYTKKQFDKTIELVIFLCNNFNIKRKSVSHNTKIDKLGEYEGIFYRSNIEKHFTDLGPSWNFEIFKEKIEQYETNN